MSWPERVPINLSVNQLVTKTLQALPLAGRPPGQAKDMSGYYVCEFVYRPFSTSKMSVSY